MRETELPRTAAWALWLPEDRDWAVRRDAVAAAWLLAAADEDSELVVQVDSHASRFRDDRGPLGALARHGTVATYKSPVGTGAMYVHHADVRLLAPAMQSAGGRSIVATEVPTVPLHGWAMAAGAVNLHTGEPAEDTRTPEQVERDCCIDR